MTEEIARSTQERFPRVAALTLVCCAIVALGWFHSVTRPPPPRTISETTRTEYFSAPDGAVCVTFTPTVTIEEMGNGATAASALRRVQRDLGKPVRKLVPSAFDSCPPRADFRVEFPDPDISTGSPQ